MRAGPVGRGAASACQRLFNQSEVLEKFADEMRVQARGEVAPASLRHQVSDGWFYRWVGSSAVARQAFVGS